MIVLYYCALSFASAQRSLLGIQNDLAVAKTILSKESYAEQSSRGLQSLRTEEEKNRILDTNRLYKKKFGFPFVVCMRMNSEERNGSIVEQMEKRLQNSLTEEVRVAIEELKNISTLRIKDLIKVNYLRNKL